MNLRQWAGHLLARLRQQVELTADPVLGALMEELRGYRAAEGGDVEADDDGGPGDEGASAGVVVPLRLRAGEVVLNLFSTTTVFGTPVDGTLSELAIEAFYPADEATGEALRGG